MNTRMISAEVLRLRKNRALVAWMFIMTTGAVTAFYVIAQGFHLNNSHQNGPAGGASNLQHAVLVISFIGSVAAAILGSTVGTSDLSSGIFRDLVVTGKSRTALFFARVPGMLLFWIPLVVLAYAVGVILDFAFAGGTATPGLSPILKDGLWAVMVTCIALCAAMGVAALIGSRGIAIGVLLGWQLAATPLLLNISQLGVTREAILTTATTRVSPLSGPSGPGGDAANALHVSLAAAIAVLLAWIIVPLAAGSWRTNARDA
jgi:ABC-type transport system involved in multi-copper enzyme maturation permease subunit